MVGSVSKSKTIHYKRVAIGNSSSTLQELLTLACTEGGEVERASARLERINPDGDLIRLINHHTTHNNMFFGQLVSFEEGATQPFINLKGAAFYYAIDSITPADIPGREVSTTENELQNRRKEFLNSILYFGVLGNHIVIMQSAALRARELETHLNWLLGTCVQLLNGSDIILHDKPAESTIRTLENRPVKTIHVGSPVQLAQERMPAAVKADLTSTETTESVRKLSLVPATMGARIIQMVVPGWFDRHELSDALDDANLKVSLEVTYLRKTTNSGQQVLDSLSTSLRHLDDSDVRIELSGGGIIQGNGLKLSGKVTVKTLPSGLIDENDLYHQMHIWLTMQISNEELEPELLGEHCVV
ncbi:hypothetical protein [uncultured Microbulbifer sp.]|uniref:hypothetical protein n=1 Tax=uncultured Microbulbifer sp. TaxID=348147 RepID=UPI002613957A|nr:hypothetical protein [uncultured Microbulbifer sp.]